MMVPVTGDDRSVPWLLPSTARPTAPSIAPSVRDFVRSVVDWRSSALGVGGGRSSPATRRITMTR